MQQESREWKDGQKKEKGVKLRQTEQRSSCGGGLCGHSVCLCVGGW